MILGDKQLCQHLRCKKLSIIDGVATCSGKTLAKYFTCPNFDIADAREELGFA